MESSIGLNQVESFDKLEIDMVVPRGSAWGAVYVHSLILLTNRAILPGCEI